MDFDSSLKRHFAVVIIALIAVAAYFQALGIAQLVERSLSLDPRVLAGIERIASGITSPRIDDHAISARRILDRNPFDSTTPKPLDAPPYEATHGGADVPLNLEHYENSPPCDGVRALVVVASPYAAWSMAALSGEGSPATKLLSIGEKLGGKTVQVIEWNRVVMSSGGALCQVQMFRSAKLALATPPPPPPPAAAVLGGASAVPAYIASKIQKVSAGEFNIDRQVVDTILENQTELMRSVRIAAPGREKRYLDNDAKAMWRTPSR